MGDPFRIVIVGAGPAGLATALAIAQHPTTRASSSRPVHITILELRRGVCTIGGAINMTPLALRYLDSLGAGARLRTRGHAGSAIELVSQRTGRLLATLWPDMDALRMRRQDLVEVLTEEALAIHDNHAEALQIVYGANVQRIEEHDDYVRVTYVCADEDTNDGATPSPSLRPSQEVTIDSELVLGCDGIHSFVRRHYVEPNRPEIYTGRCAAYGFIPAPPSDAARWTRCGGVGNDEQPLVHHATVVQHGAESLLLARYQPPEQENSLYLAGVMSVHADETSDNREGWAVQGADKDGLRRRLQNMFAGGGISCLEEMVTRCDNWFFYPVHILPDGGVWSKGRVLLLGDAAHAMPPRGESTGVAIEDGVLLAHVLSRWDSGRRSVPQIIADYEALRRADVAALYRSSIMRWSSPVPAGWVGRIMMEWMVWLVVFYLNWTSNHFARDVRKLPLPK